MSKIINELKSIGCDINGAMERFMDDETFYEECLLMTMDDASFEKLGEELKSGNITEAFNAAHTLKGVVANMSLTPLYNIVVKIVEPLRAGKIDNLLPIYDELMKEKAKISELISKC